MFYGVITQTDWQQIFKDHPEINQLRSSKAIEQKVFAILLQTILDNPFNSIKGIIWEWKKFFLNDKFSIFFIERNQLETSLRILASIGLVFCFLKPKKPTASLIIMYALGVIASVPFLASSFRTYAATVIIFPVLSALGLTLILQKVIQPLGRYCWNLLEEKCLIPQANLTQIVSARNIQKDSKKARLDFSLWKKRKDRKYISFPCRLS